ncbi:putative Non-classical export protein 2 [Calycina marina]|uniref:Non-classical export protein 2 n=1 Tax=Calycina marina TaxID=1763456 RepID=A0A9P8CIT1_9HELO|nr:putative Non-classical export protein 2 [Calycina marina]
MQIPLVALRAIQLLLVVITTALVGNAIQEAFAGNPSSVNFAIFAAVFALITVLYGLVAAFMDAVAVPILLMALDAISLVATFIAGVVLAAKLGVHSCGNQSYILSNSITNGSHNPSKRCHELQAATAFFWFLFATFIATLALTAMASKGSIGGIRRGGAPRSQV